MTRREWKRRKRKPDLDILIMVLFCIAALIAWGFVVGLPLVEIWQWGTHN